MKWRIFPMAMASNGMQQAKKNASSTPTSRFTYQLSDGNTLYVPLTSLRNSCSLPESRGPNFTLPASAVASLCRVRDAEGDGSEEKRRKWEPWCRWLDLQEGSHKLPPTMDLKNTKEPIRPLVEEFLEEINAKIDSIQRIVIGGEGEPTLVRDKLFRILKAIRESSATIPIRINTNGIVEDPEPFIRFAKDFSVGFSVSVMTQDANVYAQLMNVDPSQHTVMENFVRNAVSADLDVEATAIERPEVNKDLTDQWVTHDLHIKSMRWRSYVP